MASNDQENENERNAQFLQDSYKAKSRNELVEHYDAWAKFYDADAKSRNSAQPEAVARRAVQR